MTILARLDAPQDFRDRRSSDRRLLQLPAAGALADVSGVEVFIHDISRSGLLIETWTNLEVGNQIEVDLPEAGRTVARVVWSTGRFFGCQFISNIPAAALSAAMLRNPIAPPPESDDAQPPVAPLQAGEEFHGVSLRTRLCIILGLAATVWAAILLVMALN